jgi:hypothetical protein
MDGFLKRAHPRKEYRVSTEQAARRILDDKCFAVVDKI